MNRLARPIECAPQKLRADWTAPTDPFNVSTAYDSVLFEQARDEVLDTLGLGWRYAASGGPCCATVSTRIDVLWRVARGDVVSTDFRLLDYSTTHLHDFQRMSVDRDHLAAVAEGGSEQRCQTSFRLLAFPAELQTRIAEIAAAHANLPRDPRIGRRIAIPRA